jgi:uncharacterized membrane protein
MAIAGSASDRIERWLITIVSVLCMAIPFEIWLIAFWYMQPEGFWQKFFLVGGGIVVLGAFQVILFFLWLFVGLPAIWEGYKRARREQKFREEQRRRERERNG